MFGRGTVTDLCWRPAEEEQPPQGRFGSGADTAGSQPAALQQGLSTHLRPFPPADTVAERQFKARTIATGRTSCPYVGLGTVIVRRDFADAYPMRLRSCSGSIRWRAGSRHEALARSRGPKTWTFPMNWQRKHGSRFSRETGFGDAQCLASIRDARAGKTIDFRIPTRPT